MHAQFSSNKSDNANKFGSSLAPTRRRHRFSVRKWPEAETFKCALFRATLRAYASATGERLIMHLWSSFRSSSSSGRSITLSKRSCWRACPNARR